MTKSEVFDELAGQLGVEILNGEYATWEDLHVELKLTAPYPSSLYISIWGDTDEDSSEPYFVVYILRLDRAPLWHVESSDNQVGEPLREAVYEALDRISDEPDCWDDEMLNQSFGIFCDVETDTEGYIQESFLHFAKGTYYEHVHDWFDKYYSKGIEGLLNPSASYARMDEAELKSAVIALVDAYIELAQRYCCSRSQIAEAMTDILDDDQLKWLGFRQYASDSIQEEHRSPKSDMATLMEQDFLTPEDDNNWYGNGISSQTGLLSPVAGSDDDDLDPAFDDFISSLGTGIINPDGECLSCTHLNGFMEGRGQCKTCINHGGTRNNYTSPESKQLPEFQVGDKVRVAYFHDRCPHNGLIGEIVWLNTYEIHSKDDPNKVEKKTQGQILYPDGTTEMISDLYRRGSGAVSPVEKIGC